MNDNTKRNLRELAAATVVVSLGVYLAMGLFALTIWFLKVVP